MTGLERLRLKSKRSEASSLLRIDSADAVSALEATAAWWICHDEGDLDAMVSIVLLRQDRWSAKPIKLKRISEYGHTDAEAMARIGDTVFVFGSNFVGKSGSFDKRRAFIARISESSVIEGSTAVEVLDLGSALVDIVRDTLKSFELLKSDDDKGTINLEGAGLLVKTCSSVFDGQSQPTDNHFSFESQELALS